MANKKSSKDGKPKPISIKQANKGTQYTTPETNFTKGNDKSTANPAPSAPELVTIGVTSKMIVKRSLAFRSAKLGNLNAAPVAIIPLPAASTVANIAPASATAPQKSSQVPSEPEPAQAKPLTTGPPGTYLIRADKSQKDFIISAGNAKRNAKRFVRETGCDGKLRSKLLIDYFGSEYDLISSLGKMMELRKKEMWGGRFIDINVDLGALESIKTTINDTIDQLGPEFLECAETVFVNLIFPGIDQSTGSGQGSSRNKSFAPEFPNNSTILIYLRVPLSLWSRNLFTA